MSSFTVTCEDGVRRHRNPFATKAEAQTFAWWGHVCTATHDIVQGTVERDLGNLLVGDRIMIPGQDIEAEVTATEWLQDTNDGIVVITPVWSFYGRFSDRVQVVG